MSGDVPVESKYRIEEPAMMNEYEKQLTREIVEYDIILDGVNTVNLLKTKRIEVLEQQLREVYTMLEDEEQSGIQSKRITKWLSKFDSYKKESE